MWTNYNSTWVRLDKTERIETAKPSVTHSDRNIKNFSFYFYEFAMNNEFLFVSVNVNEYNLLYFYVSYELHTLCDLL